MRYGLLTPNAESTRASDLTERDGEECCSPDFLGVAAVRGRTWPGHSSVSLSRALGHGEGMRPSEIFTAQVGVYAGLVVWGTHAGMDLHPWGAPTGCLCMINGGC